MAESHKSYSKSKSYKSSIEKEENTRSRKKKCNSSEKVKKQQLEIRTPPFPSRSKSTMDELLKERKSLQNELKKIEQHSGKDLKTKFKSDNKKCVSSPNVYPHKTITKRKHTSDHSHKKLRNDNTKPLSPEYNLEQEQLESEDEESIIEQRRKERKKLLEKFSVTQNENNQSFKNNISNARNFNQNENLVNTDNTKPVSQQETTDMFSENDDFNSKSGTDLLTQDNKTSNAKLIDNWDDSEGYYVIRVGDTINNNRYTIKNLLGQGVFANVVRAQDCEDRSTDVAIKIVRNNDLMYKTSLKEVAILKEINDADPENKYHCIKFLRNFMHKGHLCLVLESLHMDMRAILKKYGRHNGINLRALMSYSRQLLLALRLLKKIGIVHADIKPDNILVNEKKNILKLCDFGSAAKIDENDATPYLVSRFYRAPEIILGIPYSHGIDIWSAACTIFEMATGKIMFTGSSNNKMIKSFMDLKGKIPTRLLKKGVFKNQHFNYNNNFLLHKKDEFTGREKVVEMTNIQPARDLSQDLKKSCKFSSNEEKKVLQLKDLLDKMTVFDSNQRFGVSDCLKHPFIQEEFQK